MQPHGHWANTLGPECGWQDSDLGTGHKSLMGGASFQAPEWGGLLAPLAVPLEATAPSLAAFLIHSCPDCLLGLRDLSCRRKQEGSDSHQPWGSLLMLQWASCLIMQGGWGGGTKGPQTPSRRRGDRAGGGLSGVQVSTQSRHRRSAPSPLPHDRPSTWLLPWEPQPRVGLELLLVGAP